MKKEGRMNTKKEGSKIETRKKCRIKEIRTNKKE